MFEDKDEISRGVAPRQVSVVGLGHIGAPLLAALASGLREGERVWGVDRDPQRLEALRRGEGVEPQVAARLTEALAREQLELAEALCESDAVIVAIEPRDGEALEGLVIEALGCVRHGGVMLIASTCSPAWFEGLRARIEAAGRVIGEDVHLAHAPERMMPGRSLEEVIGLPRVIGGASEACARLASSLYASFSAEEIRCVSLEEAALVKLVENGYRALNVVFANEVAAMSERYGLDPWRVIAHANEHPRVAVHQPGVGAWGRCLPLALDLLGEEREGALAREAARLNAARPEEVARRVLAQLAGVSRPCVVVCGVSYKADQPDVREAGGVKVCEALRRLAPQAVVRVVDPVADAAQGRAILGEEVAWYTRMEEGLSGAHAAIFTVAHSDFCHLDASVCRTILLRPQIVMDACGLWRR